ncbi:hypothetical protein ID866_9468 [Astraeus odoratus]|nr:hypothetical protein ID866_9468 [Astraeus odoratus]
MVTYLVAKLAGSENFAYKVTELNGSPCFTSITFHYVCLPPHPSPNDVATAKVKDSQQCTEEDWTLVSEAELDPMLSNDKNEEQREAEERRACEEAAKKAWEEAERQAKEACKVQEATEKEREEREAAVQKAWEAVEAWADKEQRAREAAEAWVDDKQRALEDRLWEEESRWNAEKVVGPSPSSMSKRHSKGPGPQDPCVRCWSKGMHCILCSWTKRLTNEKHKQKRVHRSEGREVVTVNKDEEEEEECLHFMVPPHLAEDHWDALRALIITLDTLSMEFYDFQRDYWGFSTEVLKVMDTIA